MTDSQLLQELKSDPVLSSTFQNIIPQLDQTNDEVTEQLDGAQKWRKLLGKVGGIIQRRNCQKLTSF